MMFSNFILSKTDLKIIPVSIQYFTCFLHWILGHIFLNNLNVAVFVDGEMCKQLWLWYLLEPYVHKWHIKKCRGTQLLNYTDIFWIILTFLKFFLSSFISISRCSQIKRVLFFWNFLIIYLLLNWYVN